MKVLLLLPAVCMAAALRRKTAIRIPSQGYRDLRDTAKGTHASIVEWEGNERPFADVLHHNRYNLEELLHPHHEYVPELLDLIRLEQAEHGENDGELQEDIVKRALAKVVPYSSDPGQETAIRARLHDLRFFDE